jgi:glutamate 5-kinase
MHDVVRQEIATAASIVVVKVGTRVLTHSDGNLNLQRIESLGDELAALVAGGRRVALVSSGAVGAGIGRLQLRERPRDVAQLQAVAAVGQSRLIEAYNRAFERHGLHAAQVLLTAEDLNDRARYLNVRNTILALFRFGAVPIINENDTVSVEELQISFGDNDRLAALVTNLLRAPLLVLLSDVEGVYDGPPERPDSRLIPTISNVEGILGALQDPARRMGASAAAKTNLRGTISLGTGGIGSKLAAARLVAAAGESAIIADGRHPGTLAQIIEGKVVGTLVLAHGPAVTSRKRWISAARTCGTVQIDDGARKAIIEQGRSLLAVGIVNVDGKFGKGDIVSVKDSSGRELGRGLCNYTSDEIRLVAGKPTDEIAPLIGHRPYNEVIHRDNFALSN